MTLLLAGFFLFTMAAVGLAGYLFLSLRTAAGPSGDARSAQQESLGGSILKGLSAVGSRVAFNNKSEGELRKQLFRAGYRAPSAYLVFYGIQFCAAVTLLLLLAWIGGLRQGLGAAFLPALCGAGFGFLLPARILDYQARARASRIRRAVPAALDLLVLALDAGQSLDQAMRDTAGSLRRIYPEISSELVFCHLEMSAGASRIDALRRLGERGGDEELRKLAHLLIDSERFGVTLGPALKTHSKYLRTRMRQRAQETARKLGVKLVLPVFFLIFPSVLLVTLGPAYLQMRQFLDQFLK